MKAKILKFTEPENVKIRIGLENDHLENIEKNVDNFINQFNITGEKAEDLEHSKIPIIGNGRAILFIYPIKISEKNKSELIGKIKALPGVLAANTEKIELNSEYQRRKEDKCLKKKPAKLK